MSFKIKDKKREGITPFFSHNNVLCLSSEITFAVNNGFGIERYVVRKLSLKGL
jgi:hypothetical protein